MEFYDFLILIRQKIILVLTIIIVLTGGTLYWTKKQPAKWQVVSTITVGKTTVVTQQKADYYLYDNYYPMQASGLVADTISNWLVSPSTVVEVFKRAGIPLPPGNARRLAKTFKTVQKTNRTNVVDFTLDGTNPDEMKKIAFEFGKLAKERLKSLGQDDQNSAYVLLLTEPAAIPIVTPYLLNGLAAFIASLILAAGLAYFGYYMKRA